MKSAVLVASLLAFSLAGGAWKALPHTRARSLDPPPELPERTVSSPRAAQLTALLDRGREAYHRRRFNEAAGFFDSAYQTALSLSLTGKAGRAKGNWGGAQFAMHQYRAALTGFLEARRLSQSAGDNAAVAVHETNISALYFEMGELDAAAEWVEKGLAGLTGPDRARHLPQLEIQLATLRAEQNRMDEAVEWFRRGILGADRAEDHELYAIGWNRLGDILLQQGDLPRAEKALLEAYYTRVRDHLPLASTYRALGRLRLAQGDLTSASNLLDRAVERVTRTQETIPTWDVYEPRARVRLAGGRWREALEDSRIALRLGRAWRWSAPADDAARVGTEGQLNNVHATLVEAGNRLYQETHDPALLAETFEADEENRAASLRAFGNRELPADLPPEYWESLTRLQQAEIAALRGGAVEQVEAARADLVRLEASVGGALRPLPLHLADASRAALEPGSALISFHLGNSISWVWALDRAGLAVYALPPRQEIEAQARTATTAIREKHPDADSLSAALYRTLFGSLAPRFQNAPHWLLELDEGLFAVPVAALVEKCLARPLYVAQRHSVELIPGAAYWLESQARAPIPPSGLFVGLGDPVYNQADTRFGYPAAAGPGTLTLPRLVGSGAEIEACARAWNGPAVLLRGPDASREKLAAQLARHPAVVHMATHYLESAARPGYGLIALSLTARGETELLTPLEISHWRIHTGLVVLSGCHSAAGAVLPGTGVQGLMRAWLAAGAQSVVGTLWDMPDDDGTFVRTLYQHLHQGGRLDVSRALRQAQLDMIQSGGRLAQPEYWAAYFVVGSQGKGQSGNESAATN